MAVLLGGAEAGTLLTESFEFVWCPLASRLGELFLPRGRVLRQGMNETVERIRAVAESNLSSSARPNPAS